MENNITVKAPKTNGKATIFFSKDMNTTFQPGDVFKVHAVRYATRLNDGEEVEGFEVEYTV